MPGASTVRSGRSRGRKDAAVLPDPCGLNDEEMSRLLRENCEILEPIVGFLAARGTSPNRTMADALARLLRAGEEPLQAAFVSRSCTALARLASALPENTLGEIVGETSDYRVLLHALGEPETLAALEAEDPLAEARLRGLQARADILKAEGGTLSVSEVAARLGITRQAVDKRRRNGSILALALGQNRYVYPSWQFTADGVLPGIERVLAQFHNIDPWTRAGFFVSGNSLLGGKRPLDELRDGNVEEVCRAAWALGEQGAA